MVIFTKCMIKSYFDVTTWYGYLCLWTPSCSSLMNVEMKITHDEILPSA
jgi:hypothetical protein